MPIEVDQCPLACCTEFKAGAYGLPAVFAGEDEESHPMLDVFMLVLGIGFFALAVGYASACERL